MGLLVLLALAAAAFAAEPSPSTEPVAAPPSAVAPGIQANDRPCGDDLKRHCHDVEPGARRLLRCLIAHRDELAPACQKRIDAVQRRRQAYDGPSMDAKQLRACRSDIETRCVQVSPGRGRWLDCLREHESALSDACKTELARTPVAAPKAPVD